LAAALVTFASAFAYGQEPEPSYPPPQSPPSLPPGQYPAPLSQTTQETYVPQSVALSGPDEITDWEVGSPVPPGYHPVQRVRKGAIIGGAVTLGALWAISACGAAIVHDANANGVGTDNADALFIPVLGPFVQMSRTTSATGNLFNLIDGLGQSAGATLLIWGLTSPKTLLVRNDLGMTLIPAPYVSSRGAGLGLTGTF
jgi:hypothetical protein